MPKLLLKFLKITGAIVVSAVLAWVIYPGFLIGPNSTTSCWFIAKTKGNVGLSRDRLAFYYRGSGDDAALVWSNVVHDSGKWYFEMEYVCGGCEKSSPGTIDGGIFWVDSKRLHRPANLINADDYFYGIRYLVGLSMPIRDGDIVGFAVDLDLGKLFYRHNGVWLICKDLRYRQRASCDPSEEDGGLDIKTGRKYAAASFIDPNLVKFRKFGWKANFGQRPFSHPMPGGYTSWDENQSQSVADAEAGYAVLKAKAWKPATPCCVDISEDGLTVRHTGEQVPTRYSRKIQNLPGRALATRYRTHGKWYYEITYLDGDPADEKPHATTIGLQDRLAQYVALDQRSPGYAGPKKDIQRGMALLRDGDIISVALDLDRFRYLVGINGRWRGGKDPATIKFWTRLKPSQTYMPVAAVACPKKGASSDGWRANFGSEPFRFKVPEGFKPYGMDN